jgi:hypothetical protein
VQTSTSMMPILPMTIKKLLQTDKSALVCVEERSLVCLIFVIGFASFFFFCAFAIMVGAAFHISPLVNG